MTTQDNTNPDTIIPGSDQSQKVTSNPATQTLFRFVSLRNPQLAKTEGNTKFIFRDKEHTGVFDDLLRTWTPDLGKSKIDFLTEMIKNNAPGIDNIRKTEKEVKEHFGGFYTFGKLLAEKGFLSKEEVETVRNGSIDLPLLWSSLIYQVLAQKDFYAKELLTQILQLIHYAKNYSDFSTETNTKKKEEKQKEIATATVVIPESLFIDSVPVENPTTVYTVGSSEVGSPDYISDGEAKNVPQDNISKPYFPSESVLKRQKVAVAVYEKEQLENLKKDLLKVQKQYRKNYQKQYDAEYKNYQTHIKPELEQYEQRLLEAEAALEEGANKASKDLALKRVTKPEIADFEFDFENEQKYLREKLSENSLGLLFGLIKKMKESDFPDQAEALENENPRKIEFPEDEYQSFDEILELVNEKVAESNEKIYQNTEVEKQEYVSIGGVLIPVSKSISETPYTYHVCAIKNNYLDYLDGSVQYNFDLQLNMPESGWDITRIYYDTGGDTEGYYEKTIIGNTIFLKNFYNQPSNIYGVNVDRFPTALEVHLFFTNGKTAVFKTSAIQPGTCVSGDFSVTGGSDTDGNNTPVSTGNTFVPKGFGIKRLGITDYLKVEQSTHAYVEGEVAAIENIMAREYREKSTRRLRRSEVTETSSSDTEREQLTDTTTSSRFEMQSEIAKMQQEATDIGITANTQFSYGKAFNMSIGASYANHRSKEDSMRQAVTQAQDVTARALDRVVTKVHQERIEKIVEEFEENNSHGFDNRKGDKHVVGVYRWVDKLMKNQVWNYGKRLMFEFAVPQPAKLHLLAMKELTDKKIIEKPVDPRTAKTFLMSDYTSLDNENTLKYWGSKYNISIDFLEDEIIESYAFSEKGMGHTSTLEGFGRWSGAYHKEIELKDGYMLKTLKGKINTGQLHWNTWTIPGSYDLIVCGELHEKHSTNDICDIDLFFTEREIRKNITVAFRSWDVEVISGSLVATCILTDEAKKQWQQKTFNAIIEAYEKAMAEYNNQVAEEDTKASNIKGSNPLFYRQIEQEVLKHNCIAYLVDDDSTSRLGKKLYKPDSDVTLTNFKVDRTDIDNYTSMAKFMEQAFEWDIMSYNLYPYYWGNKAEWGDMYVSENIDPLFRSFLRSGMARVVVTVRPGFEDAVQFYMSTGRLWIGGEVPVIGDPMYLSIVDEMKDIKGETQGKPWITRIPTSLTILQAQSIGLEVQHALPFTTEDPELFENPEEVITESNFIPVNAMMEAEKSKLVENIEINNDYLQLTNNDNPHQVIAQLSLDDLKEALE